MFINKKIIIKISIDNLIILRADLESIKKVKKPFKRWFEIKDKREAKVI